MVSEGRPERRPSHFPDAGITLLRSPSSAQPEIWCRCDGGPHGFLSIAAHAHADAHSIEVRIDGVDVLADPGTYCYHGEEAWRSYFRSTIAHNTVEVAQQDQSRSGGPFLWLRHAAGRVTETVSNAGGDVASWSAEHDGYQSLSPPAIHRRKVDFDDHEQTLRVTDRIEGGADVDIRMAYHLGPDVRVDLDETVANLRWPTNDGSARATLELPDSLVWTEHKGETDPALGWYSPRFGHKVASTALVGAGRASSSTALLTTFSFQETGR